MHCLFSKGSGGVCGKNFLFSRSPVLLNTIAADRSIIIGIKLIFTYDAVRVGKFYRGTVGPIKRGFD